MLRFYIIFVYLRRPVKKFLPFLLLTLLLLLPAPLVLGEGDATAAPTPEVTPAPTEAPTPSPTPDPLLNSRCTLDWQGFCNYPNRLTDNSYKSGADLRKGMKGGIYWTEDVPAGIVCWEWIVPPTRASTPSWTRTASPSAPASAIGRGIEATFRCPTGPAA